jgi:lipopolysaccharide biosynthesis protein
LLVAAFSTSRSYRLVVGGLAKLVHDPAFCEVYLLAKKSENQKNERAINFLIELSWYPLRLKRGETYRFFCCFGFSFLRLLWV